jgi:hypothetical protein
VPAWRCQPGADPLGAFASRSMSRGGFRSRAGVINARKSLKKWCCRTGLNCRPPPYQGGALPLSYGSMRGAATRPLATRRGPCHSGGWRASHAAPLGAMRLPLLSKRAPEGIEAQREGRAQPDCMVGMPRARAPDRSTSTILTLSARDPTLRARRMSAPSIKWGTVGSSRFLPGSRLLDRHALDQHVVIPVCERSDEVFDLSPPFRV